MMSQYVPQGKPLGKGSQGKVLLSNHKINNIPYAVKVVSKAVVKRFHSFDDQGFKEVKMMREANAIKCRNVLGFVQAMED